MSGGVGENRDFYLENSLFKKALNHRSFSQAVYHFNLVKIGETPSSIKKWNSLINDLNPDDWDRIFKMPWALVNEAKICYFQFKFLHRILPTNRLLNLMGIADLPLRSFCKIEEETLEHLFWECTFTSSFILDVEMNILQKQFFFTKQDLFFGYNNTIYHPYNFLILHIKYFIFCCKQNNEKPCFKAFYHKLKFILQVEMFIYAKNLSKNFRKYSALQKLENDLTRTALSPLPRVSNND